MDKMKAKEKLSELMVKIDSAKAKLYLTMFALDHGKTDLELEAARALKQAYDELAEVSDDLVAMGAIYMDLPAGHPRAA